MVLAASVPSQMAAISAAGILIFKGLITRIEGLLLLFIARVLHLGIGFFRVVFPTNIALFGKSLGLKITLVFFLLIELGTLILVVLIIHLI